MNNARTELKLGVLASGSGTNLQAIIDGCASGAVNARVSVVISDVPSAAALKRARSHGIPAVAIERGTFASKADFERAIVHELVAHEVELVCLAGYMRIVGPTLLDPYRGRMINIHPALLPSFPGLNAQQQAWEYGVKIAGCTVHFVDEMTDHGPIIMQAAVDVREDDTVEALQKRILTEEHRIYPAAIDLIARGMVRIEGRKVYTS